MRIATMQLCSTEVWQANAEVIARGLIDAKRQGVDLVVLPENCAVFGVAAKPSREQAQQYVDWFAEQARQQQLWILAGTLPLPWRPDGTVIEDGRTRSAALLFSAQGELVGRYDKRHLFDAIVGDAHGHYRESQQFEPGEALALMPTPWGRLGVLTCYDLRFPLQAQRLRALGADILAVPAAFTAKTGEAHWQVLLRARAIENQCLVVASAQGGQHSESRQTWGHSQIIDAWGRVLVEQTQPGYGLSVVDWDADAQAQLREQMPLLAHRRD